MDRYEVFNRTFQRFVDRKWKGSPLRPLIDYALFPGGKRLRPLMSFAICSDLGGNLEDAMGPAAALECLHIASLIHDDLPCLDDDELRRGLPTCHVRFGEAEALLAGDALIGWAFELAVHRAAYPAAVARALSDAFVSLCLGQFKELLTTDTDDRSKLRIDELKTGALFGAALRIGAICARGENNAQDVVIEKIGRDFGVLFQAQDDQKDGDRVLMSNQTLRNYWSLVSEGLTSLHEQTGRQFAQSWSILVEAIPGGCMSADSLPNYVDARSMTHQKSSDPESA